jgi:hypothetical protein
MCRIKLNLVLVLVLVDIRYPDPIYTFFEGKSLITNKIAFCVMNTFVFFVCHYKKLGKN